VNILKQLLKQPGMYANTAEEEIWNGNANDIRLDLPEDIRREIAIEVTRISEIGFSANNEYASLIKLDTGEVVFSLKKGVKKKNGDIQISLKSWKSTLTKSNKNSLLIVHNHPNKSIHSSDDIETFYKNESVNCLLVISGDRIFNLQRTEDTIEDIDEFRSRFCEHDVEEIKVDGKVDSEKLFIVRQKVFCELGVILERW
jgi:hypothetical protein